MHTDSPEKNGNGAVNNDRPVKIPVSGCLDLHTFAPRDIPSVVEEYLNECSIRGILEVRVIHGKGTGFQRCVVSGVLDRLPIVESYWTATPEAGGWGATMVRLKEKT